MSAAPRELACSTKGRLLPPPEVNCRTRRDTTALTNTLGLPTLGQRLLCIFAVQAPTKAIAARPKAIKKWGGQKRGGLSGSGGFDAILPIFLVLAFSPGFTITFPQPDRETIKADYKLSEENR